MFSDILSWRSLLRQPGPFQRQINHCRARGIE
jgi:hypothetical protein